MNRNFVLFFLIYILQSQCFCQIKHDSLYLKVNNENYCFINKFTNNNTKLTVKKKLLGGYHIRIFSDNKHQCIYKFHKDNSIKEYFIIDGDEKIIFDYSSDNLKIKVYFKNKIICEYTRDAFFSCRDKNINCKYPICFIAQDYKDVKKNGIWYSVYNNDINFIFDGEW